MNPTPPFSSFPQPGHRQPAAAPSRLMRPPFVDTQTNIMYDVNDPEYEGWLTKQSTWLKEWRRRYFILKGSKLFYCKNEYSGPHGMIDLASCTTVKSADLKSKKRHSLEISTPETQILLYADSEVAKDDWIGRVGKAIVRCSRTYYQQPGATTLPNGQQADQQADDDDDDIYVNDDPDNPYFND
uniref:PH domain-containing protein n=1 Tax=Amphora coffeiformis TaxID=265554 RepID=A0A7S3LD69_9STRA|mmetsp:Transcript_10120/g.19447  ORF Transcript_10120/g.19447 Transcript_10120/m.19447 type:complete len:184 (-) Transcript_10120:84-635(-)